MDRDIVQNKLESLIRCVYRTETKTPPSLESLETDLDIQDIIVVNLERAVQICVDIGSHLLSASKTSSPVTMADVFRDLSGNGIIPADLAGRLARSVGFRNIAVHQYQSINWSIVYSIITRQLDDFRQFAGCVQTLLDNS